MAHGTSGSDAKVQVHLMATARSYGYGKIIMLGPFLRASPLFTSLIRSIESMSRIQYVAVLAAVYALSCVLESAVPLAG